MMLVSELSTALFVWIVGSAARVGCTRHRLHKPPVQPTLFAGREPLSRRAFESMTGSRSGLPVMGAALDPRVLVAWCATVGTAWHCRLEGAARELLVGARSSGPLRACSWGHARARIRVRAHTRARTLAPWPLAAFPALNLDEAVDLVCFAFQHANPGDLFIQKAPASTIADLAEAVQEVFGHTGTQIIGTRHGEKLYETLMTCEERLRAEDMGNYFRVHADTRDLNYDKFVAKGDVKTQADEAYTSHNTERLDVAGTVAKIKTAEYVQLAMEGRESEAVQ